MLQRLLLPLPRRCAPYPWEDLSSLICRVSRRMGYEHPQWILQPDKSDHHIRERNLPVLSTGEDYSFLEQLLCLDQVTIYEMTTHRFASIAPVEIGMVDTTISSPPSINRMHLKEHIVKDYFFDLSQIRVCPLCLQEDEGYDRLYWRMQCVFLCPHHRLPLQEYCSTCQAPIRAFRPLLWNCPACGQGDYRLITHSPCDKDSILYLGELLFLHAWGILLPEWDACTELLATSRLVQLASTDYIHFFHAIFFSLIRTFLWKDLLLISLSLGIISLEEATRREGVSSVTATAFLLFHAIFMEWPTRFFAFLDLLYCLSQPPFRGETKTVTVSYCQQVFCDLWPQET